jgi:hypothetical protein
MSYLLQITFKLLSQPKKEKPMLWRLTATSLAAIGLIATQSSASPLGDGPRHHGKRHLTRSAPSLPEIDHFARPNPDYLGWAYVHHSPGRWIYFGPGYTFVPSKGIIDEACDLPTSACPNSSRPN